MIVPIALRDIIQNHNMKPTLGNYSRVLRGQNYLWCRLIISHRKAVNTLDAFEHEKGVVRVVEHSVQFWQLFFYSNSKFITWFFHLLGIE